MSKANVTLNVTSTPIQPLVEGQRVTLFCATGPGGDVSFRLVNTSKPLVSCSGTSCSGLSSTGVYRVSRNDSGVALTITKLERKRDGNIWVCQSGPDKGCFVLRNITVPIRNVTISHGNAVTRGEVTGDSGSLQGFSCRANPGSPNAIFHWRLIQATGTTTELVPKSTVYTNATGDPELVTSTSTLQFVLNKSMNGASLECSATNNDITSPATDSVKLNVLYGPDVVRIQTISPGYSDGSHVTALKCTANCNPPCTYQWSRAGQLVHNGSVLSIPKLTNLTAGQYTCLTSYGGRNFTTNSFLVMVSVTHERPRADQKSSPSSAPIVAGISMGLCLVVIATITVAVYIRRKRKFSKRQGESTTEMTSWEEDGHTYENATIKTGKEPKRLKPKPNDTNAQASASGPTVYTDLQPRGPDDVYEDISLSNDP